MEVLKVCDVVGALPWVRTQLCGRMRRVAGALLAFCHCASSSQQCSEGADGTVYTREGATLAISTNDPPPSDLKVNIRGRHRLVYSARDELPEYIGAPSNANFPLVVQAASSNETAPSIDAFSAAARDLLSDHLISKGAIMFRGLPTHDADAFNAFAAGLGWTAVTIGGGGTQRQQVAGNVRSASEEPAEHTIEPHMDMAHSIAHPKRIAFYMSAGPPPGVGGETVLTDMRAVYASLAADGIPQAFEARGGVAYHKRLWSDAQTNHTQYTWQKFFFTPNLEVALEAVRKRDPDARIHEHGPEVIDFQEVLPAVHAHPHTGEPTWFNGVHTNHHSYYEEALHVDTSDGSPMDSTYADGTPIPDKIIAAIRAAFWKASVAIPLRTGDVVVVDNMLASHGRMSWVPPAPRRMMLTHFS